MLTAPGCWRGTAARTDSELIDLYAAHAAALTAGDGPALEEVARRFEHAGARLLAAEVAMEAAAAFSRRGTQSRARTATAFAERLRPQGARTRALMVPASVSPLTRREREVVRLASAGLSNGDIADRLGVGVRTVEGHMQRAFAKLGVRRRADLGSALND